MLLASPALRWNRTLILMLQLLFCSSVARAQQQQDPMSLNGGTVLAMAGDGCIALAVDKRFGSGPQMVHVAPRHVLIPHSHLMVAFVGLEGDVQSLSKELELQVVAKHNRALGFGIASDLPAHHHQEHVISPRAMASLTSQVLYSRRASPFFVEPIIAGFSSGKKPYLCSQDVLGARSLSRSFVCAGVASKSMYGTTEALWRPNLPPDQLVRVCAKAFTSALERDCLSGYGVRLYLLTPEGGIEVFDLETRSD